MALDDERQRRPIVPGVPGVRLPELEDDDIPRNVRRSHPGSESTEPPPPDPPVRPVKPPYEPNRTPYPTPAMTPAQFAAAYRRQGLPVPQVLPPVEQAPASSADAVQIKIPPKVVAGLGAAILGAALSGVGLSKATEKQGPSTESFDRLTVEIKGLREDIREVRDHQRALRTALVERWDLTSAFLCKINGKSWARGIDCDALDVEFEPLPAGVVYVPPKFKANAQWPYLPRTP